MINTALNVMEMQCLTEGMARLL